MYLRNRILAGVFGPIHFVEVARYRQNGIRYSHFNRSRPLFVWFSDLVVIKPIKAPEEIILNALEEAKGAIPLHYDLGTVKSVWKNIIEDESRLKELYNPRIYENRTNDKIQLKRFVRSHYKNWLETAIRDTLNELESGSEKAAIKAEMIIIKEKNNKSPLTVKSSPREASGGIDNKNIVVKRKNSVDRRFIQRIYHELVDPKAFYIPENIRKLLGVLQLRKIKWGIVANSGPHLPEIMAHLTGVEKIHEENGEYYIQLVGSNSNSSVPILNAIDDGWPKPYLPIFRKAILETNNRLKVKSTSIVPLPEIYFVGCSVFTDNNVRGLSSLSIKSVFLTESLEFPTSDIEGLDISIIQNLNSFRIADISELYCALFPRTYAEYYRSALSVTMIAEASTSNKSSKTTGNLDGLSTIFKPQKSQGDTYESALVKPQLPPEKAKLSFTANAQEVVPSQISSINEEKKELGLSDFGPAVKKQILKFEAGNTLQPLHDE